MIPVNTKLMKELKDYIHLYAGCEVIIDGKERGRLVGGDFVPNSVNKIYFDIVLPGEDPDLYIPYNNDYGPILRIRPILRRLDSMTEDEIFHLLSFDGDLSTAKLTRASIEGNFIQCEYVIHGAIASVWMHASRFLPSQFQYLLSLGFDLFGLIDAGIAIDKSITP